MKIEKLFEKIKSDKKIIIIILVGIFGTVLLMFSGQEKNSETETANIENKESNEKLSTIDEVEEKLETKLQQLISSMNGVGEVKVVVTVASSDEYIFAENIRQENDSDSSSTDRTVIISENKEGDGVVEKSIKNPDVLGVAVVCQGADSLIVKSEIVNLVTSLFGIGIDRVYVGNMT